MKTYDLFKFAMNREEAGAIVLATERIAWEEGEACVKLYDATPLYVRREMYYTTRDGRDVARLRWSIDGYTIDRDHAHMLIAKHGASPVETAAERDDRIRQESRIGA